MEAYQSRCATHNVGLRSCDTQMRRRHDWTRRNLVLNEGVPPKTGKRTHKYSHRWVIEAQLESPSVCKEANAGKKTQDEGERWALNGRQCIMI